MNREIKKLLKIVEEKKRINPQGKNRIADVIENKEIDCLPLFHAASCPIIIGGILRPVLPPIPYEYRFHI